MPPAGAGAVGDRTGDSSRLLLAFGLGFSYQLGLDEPPQGSKGGEDHDGENRPGRWAWESGERERRV